MSSSSGGATGAPASQEFPLLWIVDLVLRHWKVLAIASLLGGLCGVAAVFIVKPMYRAEVTALSTRSTKGRGLGDLVRGLGGAGLSGVVGATIEDNGQLDQDIALINSRVFGLQFVRERELMPSMFPDRWDAANKKWASQGGLLSGQSGPPTDEQVFKVFSGRRQVQSDADSGIVRVRVEWTDAETAARLANEIVSAINLYARSRVSAESARSLEYLNRQLTASNVLELRQMLYGLFEEQTKRAMLAEVREDFIFSVIDPAIAPERAIRPRPLLYVASGLAVGFVLAFMFVVVRYTR